MSRRSRGQWFSAVSFLGRSKTKHNRTLRPVTRPLRLELLEDRRVLATYYLTHSNDDMSVGSLRWAITQANANPGADTIDTVEVQGSISIPRDINLTLNGTALPAITDHLAIIGHSGSGFEVGRLTVSGNDLSRVFQVDFGVTLNLFNATIKQGFAEKIVGGEFYGGHGGAILNFGTLNITNSTITDSRATAFGGGIANLGAMTIANSTISANEAPEGGGMVNGGALTITNSTFAGNLAASSVGPAMGGGLSNRTGVSVATTLDRVTFQGNAAVGSHGVGAGNGVAAHGGGVYVARGIVTFVDCTIGSNTAQGGNGGVGVVGTDAPATPTLPAGQSGAQGGTGGTGGVGGAGFGGGVYVLAGEVTALRTTISGNLARGGAGGVGGKGGEGGIGVAGQDTRTDTFGGVTQPSTPGGRGGNGGWGGTGGVGGTGSGGGVYHLAGSLVINNSTLANNQATGGVGGVGGEGRRGRDGGNGGSGSLSASNFTNGANGGAGGNGGQGGSSGGGGAASGGGLVHAGGALRLLNATLADNQATGAAAALAAVGGAAGLEGAGGLGYFSGGSNGAPGAAGAVGGAGAAGALGSSSTGGLAADSGVPNSVFLANSIVARNNANGTPSNVTGNVDPLSRHNLIGASGAGGLLNGANGNLVGVADPRLGTLASNGGPTQTIALLYDSPALNGGDNAWSLNPGGQPSVTDQRGTGFPRIVGAAVDIGAFESPFGAESLLVTTLADEDNGFSNPALGTGTSLREAINWANLHAGADTIIFAPLLTGGVITLGGTQLPVISGVLAIDGLGPVSLSISGNNASRVFEIAAGADATLSGISIVNGYASRGGGIYNLGTLAITGSVLSANVAFGTTLVTDIFSSTTSDGGGGIFNAGTLMVVDSTFSENSAILFGGGLTNAGVLTMIDSVISENSAAAGGGIYNNRTLNVSKSTLSNNSATDTRTNFGFGGGGGIRNDATATLINSTLANNSATRNGGGIFNFDETVTLLHSTLSGNRADADGNNSTDTGGGVFTSANAFTFTPMRNTIVAGNLRGPVGATTANDLGGKNAEPSTAYNLIGAAASAAGLVNGQGGNIVGVDPKLGPLVENGGLTQTFALLVGSPAINAGDPAFDPNTFTPSLMNDQRGGGFARVLGGRIDIGAVEVPSGDFNADGKVDGADFLHWQRQYGSAAAPIGAGADGNGSGTVDGADLGVWRGQYGQPNVAAPVSARAVLAPAVDEATNGVIVSMGDASANEVLSSIASSLVSEEAVADSALIAIAQAESGFRHSPSSNASDRRVPRGDASATPDADTAADAWKEFCLRENVAPIPRQGWEAFFSKLGEDADDENFECIALSLLEAI